jgi:hypothetical protein
MRRLLAATTLTLALAVPASSQTTLGVRGGVNFASLSGDVGDVDGRTALNVGATAHFPLSDSGLGLLIGGFYTQKGASESAQGLTATVELDYVEIPVLLRYDFPSQGSASFHAAAGPAVGFEVGCSVSADDGGTSASVDCDEAGLSTTSVDFGLVGGLGVDFRVSEGLIVTVDGMYNLGLTNIADSDEDDVKNRVFMLQAGVAFPVGGG